MAQIPVDTTVTEDVRPAVEDMSTDEMLREIVTTMRAVSDALAMFQNMGPGGVMKMIMGR